MNKSFIGINIGDKYSYSKLITQNDVELVAIITGDHNPIHLDEEMARKTIFGSRIVHGVLVEGLISTALTELPGIIIYLSQYSRFLKPVRANDTIKATIEVIEKYDERNELRVKTICKNQLGITVLDGEARIKVLEVQNG
jgi:3-hydroxybutyryl-CoA dehydratase